MFYAVRSKPESLLYYPIFKVILLEGWKGTMNQDQFKELLQTQIKKYQDMVAMEQQ